MYQFFHDFQLSVMLFLSGACGVLAMLSMSTATLSSVRRRALVSMEIAASLLLLFDRQAYLHRGLLDTYSYYMVRISNFFVFFFTLVLAHTFNLYLMDMLKHNEKVRNIPRSLICCEVFFSVGVVLLVISQFTGWYYTFNSHNEYQRGSLFIVCYIMPILMTTIQLVVILKYRKILTKMEFIPVILFAVIPYIASFAQIFMYGLSLTNISMVGMAVLLYFFEIININTLEEKKREAEAANTAKSRFLTNISHELRTPINTIMGMGEMIIREDASNVPHDYYKNVTGFAKDIRTASDSLLSLVNDILDISEIESGKVILDENDYNLKDTIVSLASTTKLGCSEKDVEFVLDMDENMPSVLYGDEPKIHRILQNILSNAVKYTNQGSVTFSAKVIEQSDDMATFVYRIKDTGMGIKDEEMEVLFSAFQTLDKVENSNIKGNGLGLDISKYFAELMGGNISCESTFGKGSTFTFTITQKIVDKTPVGSIEEKDDDTYKGAYIPRFIAPDISVLVVDDNPMNLSVIKGLLSPTKMYVVAVESGKEALTQLQDNHYNLVLLDHMMPEMDGLETLERIREFNKTIPVIALTANYISNGVEFYTSKGFDGYLAKPVDGETLEKAIRKFLPDDAVMDVSEDDMLKMEVDNNNTADEYEWLNNVDGISVEEGLKYSGSREGFIFSLKMFLDTIPDNIKTISDAFDEEDFKLYTTKVHALKSSARIIGAKELSEMAKALEDAGKAENIDFIRENNQALIDKYSSYKEILARLKPKEEVSDKEPIPPEELQDAIEAMKELVQQMDFDAMEMVLDQLKDYRLEEDAASLIKDVKKALRVFDWDKLEELLADK